MNEPLEKYEQQGADPDPRILLDSYTPPVRQVLLRRLETCVAIRGALRWELTTPYLQGVLTAAERGERQQRLEMLAGEIEELVGRLDRRPGRGERQEH